MVTTISPDCTFVKAALKAMDEEQEFRQIEIDCKCGNQLSATVISTPYNLTCIKCGKNYIEELT
jgi:hypothetical protein